jgi:hypothetical protein
MAQIVLKVTAVAGIQLVRSDTVADHASRYEVVPVYAQHRPIKAKPYPDNPPIAAMRAIAGRTAPGADPHAAIPAGKLSTPAPTIPLTRLKMSCVTDASPPPPPPPVVDEVGDSALSDDDDDASADVMHRTVGRRAVVDCRLDVPSNLVSTTTTAIGGRTEGQRRPTGGCRCGVTKDVTDGKKIAANNVVISKRWNTLAVVVLVVVVIVILERLVVGSSVV